MEENKAYCLSVMGKCRGDVSSLSLSLRPDRFPDDKWPRTDKNLSKLNMIQIQVRYENLCNNARVDFVSADGYMRGRNSGNQVKVIFGADLINCSYGCLKLAVELRFICSMLINRFFNLIDGDTSPPWNFSERRGLSTSLTNLLPSARFWERYQMSWLY